MEINEKLESHALIPVVVINDADKTEALCNALAQGGLPVAEITFRTAAAEDSIRQAAKIPGMTIGAGTVINPDQAKAAAAAGAKFIVSPGFGHKVVAWCLANDMPVFPGVATPTEVQAAIDHGISTVKVFPVESLGGAAYLKALAAPFPQMKFVPTGGVGLDMLAAYLQMPQVVAVGGSWMVPASDLNAGRFETIRHLTAESVGMVKALRGTD